MSFKVGVKTPGDCEWSYNGLRFATKAEAEAYGADLAWRWTAVTAFEAHECSDEVTAVFADGQIEYLNLAH